MITLLGLPEWFGWGHKLKFPSIALQSSTKFPSIAINHFSTIYIANTIRGAGLEHWLESTGKKRPSWSLCCPCCSASLALARAPDTAFRLLPPQTGARCHDARQHCHIKGASTSRPLARAAPSRREGRFDGKRILKSGSSRGGFAGSRGHDSSKEVNHGSFAPRTSQIRAELAEIDHARHQNGDGQCSVTPRNLFRRSRNTKRT